MKTVDLTNVPDRQEFSRLTSGAYICKIGKVDDQADKECLKIEYDIAVGQFKDYYTELFVNMGFWGGTLYRSYKDSALSFFKGFITAIANSNPGFAWTSNEQQLVGKLFGAVIAEEEYFKKDGTIGTRLYVADVRSIDKIKSGDFKVPSLKTVNKSDAKTSFKGTEVSL